MMTSSLPTHASSQPHRTTCVSCPQISHTSSLPLGLQHWPVPLPEILHGHLPHFLQVFIQMIGLPWKLYLKLHSARVFLDVQWLGLTAFTAGAWVQSLAGELRSHKLYGQIYIYIYIHKWTSLLSPYALLPMALTMYYLFIVCLYQSLKSLSTLIYHKYHTGLVNERMKRARVTVTLRNEYS